MKHAQIIDTLAVSALLMTACGAQPPSAPSAAPTQVLATATPAALPPTATARVALAPASCPVTRPPNPPFVPPSPFPPTAPPLYQGFWFGTEALWTMPRTDGIWRGLAWKVFWWRRGYDYQSDPRPDLIVTGRRLDAPAPPFTVSGATNGNRSDIGSFMLVGVDVPTPGCWEITGQGAGANLSFVMWVVP